MLIHGEEGFDQRVLLILEVVKLCFTVREMHWQQGMSTERCYTSLEKAGRKIQGTTGQSFSIPQRSLEQVFMKAPPLPSLTTCPGSLKSPPEKNELTLTMSHYFIFGS